MTAPSVRGHRSGRMGHFTASSPSVHRLIALILLAGLLLLRYVDPPPVERLRLALFDLFQWNSARELAADAPVVVVDIDDDSLRTHGQWPWPRTDMAQLVVNLVNAGAVVVGFDIVFAEPDRLSPDRFAATTYGLPDELKQALSALASNDDLFAGILEQTRVVLGQALTPEATQGEPPPRKATIVPLNGDPRPLLWSYPSAVRNVEVLEDAAAGLGMFVLVPDQDTLVRRVPGLVRVGDQIYPALALEMLRVAAGEENILVERDPDAGVITEIKVAGVEVPTDENGNIWVRFARTNPDLYVPASDVLDGTFDPARFSDRFVLIGATATALGDIRATPLSGRVAGVEIHAQLLENLLSGHPLRRPYEAKFWEMLATGMFGLALIILVPSIGARWSVPVYLTIATALFLGSWYLFTDHLLLVDATFPVLGVLPVFIALVYANYARVEAQKAAVEAQRRRIRSAFVHYLSPTLVEELATDPERLRLGGETKEMTMLFSDVHGFTALSEIYKYRPQDLTRMINELLSPLADAILEHLGTIDKYMGDAIMAFWNAPVDFPDHPLRACRAALAMQQSMRDANDRHRQDFEASRSAETGDRSFIELKVGIGINTGTVVVGNMGTRQRFDYSVLGDAVNLASRLEGQTRSYGVDTIVGPATAAQVMDRLALIELDLVAVVGKSEAERIYALLGDETVRADPAFRALHDAHQAMITAYRQQDWDEAERLMADCRRHDEVGLEALYLIYAQRIENYRRRPPEPGWTGVHVSESK